MGGQGVYELLDCEQSLFLSLSIAKQARESGNRARSASEREMGRAEVSHQLPVPCTPGSSLFVLENHEWDWEASSKHSRVTGTHGYLERKIKEMFLTRD